MTAQDDRSDYGRRCHRHCAGTRRNHERFHCKISCSHFQFCGIQSVSVLQYYVIVQFAAFRAGNWVSPLFGEFILFRNYCISNRQLSFSFLVQKSAGSPAFSTVFQPHLLYSCAPPNFFSESVCQVLVRSWFVFRHDRDFYQNGLKYELFISV